MASIVDERGFNQGFVWNSTQAVRIQRRAHAILHELPPGPRRVLEWGCGTGELAHFLAEAPSTTVTGADLSHGFIAEARRRFSSPQLEFVQADLSTPAGRASAGLEWDAIVGNGILHHLYHHMGDALASMRSMLKPGGQLVFWEPNLFNPYVYAIFSFAPLRKLARLEPDEMAFTPRWIEGQLRAAGFTEVSARFRDFVIPNLPYRLVPLFSSAGDVVEKLPVVNRLAQSLFITARR